MTTILAGAHVSPSGEPGAGTDSGLPVGAMVNYGGISEPLGWYFCHGQAVSRIGINADLFAKLGISFGEGDGSTTFNLPDFRGRVGVGLGNMGGTHADRMSFSKTCNTALSTTLTTTEGNWSVVGRAQLSVGMFIHGPNIPAGTTIVSIGSAASLVMSAAATLVQSGITVRFSVLDKLSLGGTGGGQTHQLIDAQMPQHQHTFGTQPVGGTNYAFGANWTIAQNWTGFAGSDQPHPNVQPSLFVNVIIKYAASLGGMLVAGTGDVVGPNGGVIDGSLAIYDGTSGKQLRSTPVANIVPVGGVVQLKYQEIPNSTSNVIIPADGTVPQIGEGFQVASQTFTPRYANSLIRIKLTIAAKGGNAAWKTIAVFRSPLAGAIAWRQGYDVQANGCIQLTVDWCDAPVTTSEITYTVRVGPNASSNFEVSGPTGGAATLFLEEIKQ